MSALLVELYQQLPTFEPLDDPDMWQYRMRDALRLFRKQVRERYSEGTLQRLLHSESILTRRATVLALGLVGTMDSNRHLAATLWDENLLVAKMAGDALWEIWFRGGSEEQNNELQTILHQGDFQQALAELDDLIRRAPQFAEAINQRAILFFQRGEFQRSLRDCEEVLRLNSFHFGAQSGMGQCYMKLNKPQAAIRAFRLALQINPTLIHLQDTIRMLEQSVDEGS